MLENIKDLYFAGHHLTRDLIGNIAPLTAASALIVATSPPMRTALGEGLRSYSTGARFWTFVLIMIVYVVAAYFVGAIANIIGNMLHRLWQHLRIGRKCSYTCWYNKNIDGIDVLYGKYFPGDFGLLASGAAISPTDKVNTLKEYLRTINPGGYTETYRQFLKVDIVRVTLVYSIVIIVWSAVNAAFAFDVSRSISVICVTVVILLCAFIELPRRVRKVVRAEYHFIIASARLKQDIDLISSKSNLNSSVTKVA